MSNHQEPTAAREVGLFPATRWTLVLGARDKSPPALEALCASYRQPLLTWLRIQGYPPPDAEDLVQGLFAHFLGRDFLQKVGPEKGTFRTFLLRCLKHHISDERAKQTAAKRGGHAMVESLDLMSEEGKQVHDPAAAAWGPDMEYDRAWAQAVLANALRRLRAECARQGHAALCGELEPVLFADETAASYGQIGARLGLTEGAVKTAAYRVRARLKGLVREEVLQTVANESDWEEEVRYLIRLFER